MKRHDFWPRLLTEAIERASLEPFEWGKNDCALFSADMIKAMTGVDVAEKYRNRYKTPIGAARITKKDPAMVGERIAKEFGIQEVEPAFAQRGDIVAFIDDSDARVLGVVSSDASKIAAKVDAQAPPYVTLIDRYSVQIYRAWRA